MDGAPLDEAARVEMEERLGHDFSRVRLHTGPEAAASARAISALAYTAGHHIVFGAGRHATSSPDGRRLLAHELTHVIQQDTAPEGIPIAYNGIAPANGVHERQAEAAARALDSPYRPPDRSAPVSKPASGATARPAAIQREADPAAVSEQDITVSASLSGLSFDVPETVVYKPGPKVPQLLAIVLRGLLGPDYKPGLEKELALAIPLQRFERSGGFKSKKQAKGGEPIRNVTLAISPTLQVLKFLKKRNLEPRLTDKQRELLNLGEANLLLWNDFRGVLLDAGNSLPAWYSRDIFDREIARHGVLLREYASALEKAVGGDQSARAAGKEAILKIIDALYQPALLLEEVRKDIALAADDETSGIYGALWRLPQPKKGSKEKPKLSAPPSRLRDIGTAVLFLGYVRTQKVLAVNAEAYPESRLELMKRFARFAGQYTFAGTKQGDEEIRDQPATANRSAFPSTLAPLSPIQPPLYEAALGTDHRFHMTVEFPSVYEALGNYSFNWERVRIPDDKIGQPVDLAKLKGEQVGFGEVAAVRFSRDTAYAKADISRAIDNIKGDLGPAGVGALELISANAILRYIGTGIRLFLETLTMPRDQKQVVFPGPGLYMVRAAMSQVREGGEEVVRAPSVAYYPVLARNPDEIASGGVERVLTAREKTKERIKELESKLSQGNLQEAERKSLQQELDALRLALAPLGSRLEQRRKESAAREKAIEAGKEPADLAAATKDRETIEKIIALRAKRRLGDNAELLTARFVSDLGQTIPLSIEVVDRTAPNASTHRVYISDVTTPKSGDGTGTGKTRDDAIADAVKDLLESIHGYGRGRVAIALGNGVRTIRIEAGRGQLLSEAIDNVAMIASIAAIAAAPFTGGATLAFLIPIGLVGAIPSAYRVAMRLEAGTFELDLENALELANIAGSLIGLGRLGATSARMMRLGKGLLVIGYGVDAAGGVLMGAQLLTQIETLSKLPPGERSAALLLLLGQTMLSAGVVVGGALAERSHHLQAEAKAGKVKGTVNEPKGPVIPEPPKRPATDAPSTKVPATDAPAAKSPPSSADIFEKAKVDREVKRLGNFDAETDARLRKNEPLRSALVENPLAAAALKKCASPCKYPKEATAEQVVRLDRVLSRLAETGDLDTVALKKYLHDRTGDLDNAIHQIEGVRTAADLKMYLDFYNSGGKIQKLPPKGDPRLLLELRDRAHDYGVEHGKAAAKVDGIDPAGFKNPFERQGRYGQGFDDVGKKGANVDLGDVYIIEYKGGDAVLARGQMELDWVIGNIRRLYNEGGLAGQQWARTLAKALREGRLKGVAYSTPLLNGVPQATVTINTWTYPKTNLKL